MTGTSGGCSESLDPRALVRQGTSKVERSSAAPQPERVPVDERRAEHAMVFAAAYGRYLRYVDLNGAATTTWEEFFTSDLSARLSVAAIEDVSVYRTKVKSLLRALEDPELPPSETQMVAALGAVFDCIGTLAAQLDALQGSLPAEHALRATMANLVRSQLSPMLRRLIGYWSAGLSLGVVDHAASPPDDIVILGHAPQSFPALVTVVGLTAAEWTAGVDVPSWAAYVAVDPTEYVGAYGPGTTVVERVNHLATHNLFTAACEAFLGAFARVVDEARAAVEGSFRDDRHEPHYALFMAFLRLLEYARADANTLTGRHLDFYYRTVLRLRERPAEPSHAHVLVELAKHVDTHLLAGGTLLRAGKDAAGADVHFAVDRDLVANRGAVVELKSLYRHPTGGPVPMDRGLIFARPAVVTEPGQSGPSWHPFAEETYVDGRLTAIDIPPAEVGFAIASHYLWMAEGRRTVDVTFETGRRRLIRGVDRQVNLACRLTTAKGWVERTVTSVTEFGAGFRFSVTLDGNDPPVTPYDAATHGYSFGTSLPVLLVLVAHERDAVWDYPMLAGRDVQGITVTVRADGVKTLALSNDQGPVDASKPFLPYGSTPTNQSSLVIGSNEVFQKRLTSVTVRTSTMSDAVPLDTLPTVTGYRLSGGAWTQTGPDHEGVNQNAYEFGAIDQPAFDMPDLNPSAPLSTGSRTGFVRLTLSGGFGTDRYPLELAKWIAGKRPAGEPARPVLPLLGSLSLDYVAVADLDLGAPSEANGRFFHVTPFGHAQQTTKTPDRASVPLLPRFLAGSEPAEGELYIGVSGLEPPQNLALLFQVVDGTANPLVVKPDNHLRWSYLRGNDWVPLDATEVADGTSGLLASGIVTVSVPADASAEHTLLPSGIRWVRLAVASRSDAVCRLLTVTTQALRATYAVRDPGAQGQAVELAPGTISKLDTPDAAVKAVVQPFPTFGGRTVETSHAFATRVSERLRHRDRAIALWDYEHLVLEAFPSIYQARCLNHTQYEPSPDGSGIYRELAPGHVTVVTIPDLALPNPRDPLRPFTSTRVLSEIERFLVPRMSCFARLHVRNPQFEEVRVALRVRFRQGVDETFHIRELRREITRFLSPWCFRGDARPSFNGKVHKSVLVNHLEELPYVDYVTDVRLFHRLPGAAADGPDREEIVGSRAISILVSMPPDGHSIQVIHVHENQAPEDCSCAVMF